MSTPPAVPTAPQVTEKRTWRPDKGDVNPLVGTLLDVTTASTAFDAEYPLAEIVDDQGVSWSFHAFRDIAKSELSRLAPEIGDLISVTYLGVPDGKRYHVYRIRFADGRSTKPDWSRFRDPPAVPVAGSGEGEEYARDGSQAPESGEESEQQFLASL
jgi:hypothetical protein